MIPPQLTTTGQCKIYVGERKFSDVQMLLQGLSCLSFLPIQDESFLVC